MGDTNDGRAVGHATGCGRSGIGPKPQRAGIPDATTDSFLSNKHGPAACIPSPACGESGPEIAPARADRSSAAGAQSYGFRSGDASEESRSRLGESRRFAPLPPGSELVESPHEVSVLELARRDTGALMGLLVLVVLFLFSPGCAPPPAQQAHPAKWCEDCLPNGGVR